jgi:hypothetical protein
LFYSCAVLSLGGLVLDIWIMKKLEWSTVQRKVDDLMPLEINPRKISEEKRNKLIDSINKFNLAEIPTINKDNQLISGHQRMKAMQMIGRGDELIDVRIPNRQLSLKELKEYNIISNTHAGEFDFDLLEMHFGDIDLVDFNIIPMDPVEIMPVNDPFDDPGIEAKNQYGVIVICDNAGVQESVFNDLVIWALNVRLL